MSILDGIPDAIRQRAAVWHIINSIEQATKYSRICKRPLIYIDGGFNGADLSPVCRALQVYKINKEPTHINSSILDLKLKMHPNVMRLK